MRAAAANTPKSRHKWLLGIIALVVVSAASLTFVAFRVQHQAGIDEARPADAIIVFGAAEYVGRPSPVYRARLDHAYELFTSGLAPLIITSGGAGDAKYTEGGVGRDYLRSRGVPDLNLIAETQGNDTAESAQRIAVILRANRIRNCLAVSDAYHMYRVKHMLQAQGIVAYGSPRPDSIPHTTGARALAALREAFSYILWKLHLT